MDCNNLDEFCCVQDLHIPNSFESSFSIDEEMSGNFDFGYFGMAAEKDLKDNGKSYFLCPEIQPTYYQEDSGRNASPPLYPESQSYTELIPVQGSYESFSLYDYEENPRVQEPEMSRLPSFDETYSSSSPSVLSSQVSINENNLAVTSVYDLSSLQTLNINDIAEQNVSNESSLESTPLGQSRNPTLESFYSYGSDQSSRENVLDSSFGTSPGYASSPSWYDHSEESYGDDKFPDIDRHATQPIAISQDNLVDESDNMMLEDGTSDWLKEIRETKNARPRGPKCWEFLLRLLIDSRSNPSLIRWEDQSQGVFRLVNKDRISAIWGSRPCKKKKEEGIKYDSFARNLRYHYKSGKGKVRSVSEKHLVYKFPNEVMDLFSNKRIR